MVYNIFSFFSDSSLKPFLYTVYCLVQSCLYLQSSLVQSSLVQYSLVQSSLVQSSPVQFSLVQSSPLLSSLDQLSLIYSRPVQTLKAKANLPNSDVFQMIWIILVQLPIIAQGVQIELEKQSVAEPGFRDLTTGLHKIFIFIF